MRIRRVRRRPARRSGVAVLIGFVVAACGQEKAPELPYYLDADLTPVWIDGGDAPTHRIRDFSLVDQTGSPVTNDTFAGGVYVANFFFTSCVQICPTLRTNMRRVQEAFPEADDVFLISHTVTPGIDSPDVLAAYARANAIDADRWRLVTGSRDEIYGLAEQSYFVNLQDASGYGVEALMHTENFVLVDSDRRIRGVYNGTLPFDVDRLIEDIARLRSGA